MQCTQDRAVAVVAGSARAMPVGVVAVLNVHGAESWIGRAVIHHHAFQLAWDVLDEKGLLTELPD